MTTKFKYSVVIEKQNTLAEFRQFSGMDGTSFSTHQTTKYGNYKSRIEAERNLIDIKKYIQTYI
jgi:hypothetical protein